MAELRRCKGSWAFCDGYCEKCNTTATTQRPTMYLMPPTAQERTRGHWIYKGNRGRFPVCECSVCGNAENADWAILGENVNYCPNCGAEMKGENDATD